MSTRIGVVTGQPLFQVDGRPRFLPGANYAWHRYGEFGDSIWGGVNRIAAHAARIEADLAAIRGHGARAVRWFLFTDGRSGIRFDAASRLPVGLANGTIEDIAAALNLASRHELFVLFSLLDYLAAFDNPAGAGSLARNILTTGDGTRAFVERVLAPVLDAFGTHDSVLGWEVMNEPDWIIEDLNPLRGVSRPLRWDEFAAFAGAVSTAVHARSDALTTVGGARAINLARWDDAALGLDFLQVHLYYDARNRDIDRDLFGVPAAALNLSRPILIGEVPGRNDPHPGRLRLEDWLAFGLDGGYAGVWPWAYTFGPGDRHAPYDGAAMKAFYESAGG